MQDANFFRATAANIGFLFLGSHKFFIFLPQQRRYLSRQSFRKALSNLDGKAPPDPQSVADAIVNAAINPAAPFRNLVGDDAVMLASAYKAAPTYEDFEAGIRERLDWHI